MEKVKVKHVLCNSCDLYCPVLVKIEDGKIIEITGDLDHPVMPNSICIKCIHAVETFDHPDRLLHPLKRKGDRGSGEWEKISWDQALDEIAEKLKQVIEKYGPEAVASSVGFWNTGDSGCSKRFMNLLGSPNWIAGVALCLGNTAAINRITYGWFAFPDYANTKCIVLWGHNPEPDHWTGEYKWLNGALERGAKLIVLDPRLSLNAKRADIHLRLRPGTDAAMALGWLNVIINEKLYDEEFVKKWTVGFGKLVERVQGYPLDKVSEITGVSADKIREAARMYATNKPAIIPWTITTDQQKTSTSAIRAHCILRAITGNLDVQGGELLTGFHPNIVSETAIQMHEKLSEVQKAKQLGTEKRFVLNYKALEDLKEPTKKVWNHEYADICKGSYQAHPPTLWRAIIEGKPYQVKALISQGNNTLMAYPNQHLIYKALKALDLLVVMDLFMTPTAQLADYVLPAASWLERPFLNCHWDWHSIYFTSQKVREPSGGCKTDYQLWRELGIRMGQEEYWPWKTIEEMYDYRLKDLGYTWEDFSKEFKVHPKLEFKKYEKIGFATPSGKVEVYSSILEKLGHDPLPYYVEPAESPISTPELAKEYPLILIVGGREGQYFHTGQRMVKSLREVNPFPTLEINVLDADKLKVFEGDWVWLETTTGKIKVRAKPSVDIPKNVVRVPHGWWFPEEPKREPELSGVWKSSDAVILSDEDKFLDPEQGVPHLRGLLCRVYPVEKTAVF